MADYPKLNIPLTDDEQKAVKATDQSWTGPRLIALLLGTMGVSLFVLYAAASEWIGPTFNR